MDKGIHLVRICERTQKGVYLHGSGEEIVPAQWDGTRWWFFGCGCSFDPATYDIKPLYCILKQSPPRIQDLHD